MNIQNIVVAYSPTPKGLLRLCYAYNLSKLLSDTRLLIIAPPFVREDFAAFLKEVELPDGESNYNVAENQRLRLFIDSLIGHRSIDDYRLLFRDIDSMELGADDLLVADRCQPERRVAQLLPQCGGRVRLYDDLSRVMIPFGNGGAGALAAQRASGFINDLQLQPVLYHTTWREDGVDSDDPKDHMCEGARHALFAAKGYLYGLHETQSEVVIECADHVADGLVEAALRLQCQMIIMAPGEQTGRGSYVQQVAEVSPIPLLIAMDTGPIVRFSCKKGVRS